MDATDRKLIGAFRERERPTNSDLARTTGLARGTVQARLARLTDTGTIRGWGPELNPTSTDHPVTSFTFVSIAQGALDVVVAGLEEIPEVLEVHVTTGRSDLLCRIACRTNDHLHQVIQDLVALDGVVRTDSQLVLTSPILRSHADLYAANG